MSTVTFVLIVGLPIMVLILSLVFGPLPIVARALVRKTLGPRQVRRWAQPVARGLAVGMGLAAVTAAFWQPELTLPLVLMCLLILLALIDWWWRWLPIEWTLGVIALGVIQAVANQTVLPTAQHVLIPSLTILALRQGLLTVLKKEALGLGDVWLIAGLGAFLPFTVSFLMIGLAALSGLAEVLLRRVFQPNTQKTNSVSYGTHLCVVFVILRSFTQVN